MVMGFFKDDTKYKVVLFFFFFFFCQFRCLIACFGKVNVSNQGHLRISKQVPSREINGPMTKRWYFFGNLSGERSERCKPRLNARTTIRPCCRNV